MTLKGNCESRVTERVGGNASEVNRCPGAKLAGSSGVTAEAVKR